MAINVSHLSRSLFNEASQVSPRVPIPSLEISFGKWANKNSSSHSAGDTSSPNFCKAMSLPQMDSAGMSTGYILKNVSDKEDQIFSPIHTSALPSLAYRVDQVWEAGAFFKAEPVLNDFFGIEPIISGDHYPFVCPK